jgi:glycosyltransferase involved in cell wall biosynthesis
MALRIAYIVTEDWYFTQQIVHTARAARDAGFEVHVLTRLGKQGADIQREGFVPHALSWTRRRTSPAAALASAHEIRGILGRIAPSLVHNVALKPAIIGSLACLGLPRIAVINSIMGLGSSFLDPSLAAIVLRTSLRFSFALLFNSRRAQVIVQNPDDRAVLLAAGVRPERIVLVPGSGVDTDRLQPLPEPGPPIRAAFVGRMLDDKGVRPLIAAHRLLRQRGAAIELILAGAPDPENPSSIPASEIEAWGNEPGIFPLGYVPNIQEVWARSHIAVLPSRREGLPTSLLEAAACGRPLVATDVPGCREIACHGETGLLVPVDQPLPLAEAIATLASDSELRRRMGAAARTLAVTRFSAADIGRQSVAVYRSLVVG